MLACLVKIEPLYRATGERLPVRVSSVNDAVNGPKVNGIGGAIWEPALVGAPVLSFTVWNGDFQAAVSVGNASLTINTNALKQTYSFADECHWIGSPVEIYAETPGTSWPWRLRFKGKISGFGRKGDTLTLGCEVDQEPFEADVLTKTYAGTGGAEGTTDLKNRVKPLVLGWAENVEPVLIDPINSVFQFSAYGPIDGFDGLYERGASFGAAIGDYADYDALVAATIPAGRWATCLAEGMVRLGAPNAGVITGDVGGHVVGSTTPELTGAVISTLADIAGIDADRLNTDALAALDVARPFPIALSLQEQTSFLDIAQSLSLACNYQAGVALDGRFTVIRISLDDAEQLTLDALGRSFPQVKESDELDVSPPYWKITVGAHRSWRVHTSDEIAFFANLNPRGRYDVTESYREGDIVDVADGSQWLYVNPVASTGNAPPTYPTLSDSYWSNIRPPTKAQDITFNDGQSIEGLQPAEARATKGAPSGTPVGSITADDVDSTINAGGGVADDQVTTPAITDLSVTRTASMFYDYAGWSYATNNTWYDLNNGSNTLQVGITTASSGDAGAQIVSIDAMVVLERDGGSDDNVGARVVRTNDSTILPETYSALRARSGKSTYALVFSDPSPLAGATNTYKLQLYNNSDDSHVYETALRATLFRK